MINAEEELRKILEAAEKFATEQTSLPFQDSNLKDEIDKSIQNPKESYNLYYQKINKLLREYLSPLLEGKKNSPHRQLIYDEKNLLLNFGKDKNKRGTRGSCGKMATTEQKKMVADLIKNWVLTDGKSSFNLFNILRDKNIELGYRNPKDVE